MVRESLVLGCRVEISIVQGSCIGSQSFKGYSRKFFLPASLGSLVPCSEVPFASRVMLAVLRVVDEDRGSFQHLRMYRWLQVSKSVARFAMKT